VPAGRPRKPTRLRLLHGDHPERLNLREPVPPPGDVSRPPYELPPAARLLWDRLAPDRAAYGLLTTWDLDSFAVFCHALSVLQRGPDEPLYRTVVPVCSSLGGRFGWTPADRAKLTAGAGPGGDPGSDLLS
jgi:phage terminase small subunit